MTGKEFLQYVLETSRLLDSQLEQFRQLQNMAYKITTVISGTPSIGDKSHSRIENAVVNTLQKSSDIENAVMEFCGLREKAVTEISKVPDPNEKIILEYRYLTGKSWEDISKLMGLTLRYTYALHGRALKTFEKNFSA